MTATDQPVLDVDFQKRLGGFHLRPHFTATDELVVLFGPSGSGKSLTLRAIAGLLRPDGGRIVLPSGPAFDSESGIDLPPQKRNVGYVVQDLALFPHLTVAENIAFSLDRWPRREREERVKELMRLLDLQGLESRTPRKISGGQQQRVALGRALASRPPVLLLDEPFSALDAPIRAVLRREVSRLRRTLGLVALFVTHDLQEAFALADSMAVYDDGAVLQYGPRAEVFRMPASVRVARLLDARNIFEGRVVDSTEAFVSVKTPWFEVRARQDGRVHPGDAAAVCIRPEHMILLRPDRPHANPLDTVLEVEVVEDVATANSHRLSLKVRGGQTAADACILEADVPAHPYDVMGVASRRDWKVALTLDQTAAIPAP
jgi:molybdate transport system ATP-binding protein